MEKIEDNFLGIPDISMAESRFIVAPIPLDVTTSCQQGTGRGPDSIIHSSSFVELYDEYLDAEPYRAGIKTVEAPNLEGLGLEEGVSAITRWVSPYIQAGKFVAGLGGEHTVTVGMFNAYASKFKDLRVLSFDAHADLRDTYNGTKFSHACVLRRITEQNFPVTALGIRSLSGEEKAFIDKSEDIKIYWAHEMKSSWDSEISSELPEGSYYITFDVDFLDPSLLPETGTPEPGGFQWRETAGFLDRFVSRRDIEIVGCDFTELLPSARFSTSSFIIAKLVYRLLGTIAIKKSYTSKISG